MIKYIFWYIFFLSFEIFGQTEEVLRIRKIYERVNKELVSETSLPTHSDLTINTMEADIGLQSCQLKFFYEVGSMNKGNQLPVKMIHVKYNIGAPEIYQEFLFENAQLIFSFLKDAVLCVEKRYYFSENKLIYYLQEDCEGKNKTEEYKFTTSREEEAQRHQSKCKAYLEMFRIIQEFKDKNW
ncbi:MAG: hypothetical protein OHK0038_13940 [Flammeovirgaceae bacterium]